MAKQKITLTPEIYFCEVPKSDAIDMSIRSELYFVNEFTFAVAVILSAQATDKKVNEVTPELFEIADTPEKMLELGENGLKEYIKVISFFNNKAKSIIGLAEQLADESKQYDTYWKFPKEYHIRENLVKLPGIGQKTANVVMNVLWGAPHIGVDTHVFRNSHRYGWVDEADNTPEKVEEKLMKLIPEKYHGMANHVMVLHGRYICKALKPKCAECPVAKWCNAKDKII
ncbi:MAG: endonuclease III [Alphaproteobacteria bacterium]|nr:endonuclease III [Alphaproteobacteria bacterium]